MTTQQENKGIKTSRASLCQMRIDSSQANEAMKTHHILKLNKKELVRRQSRICNNRISTIKISSKALDIIL